MGAQKTLRTSFGQKLRAELDRKEWGVRTLAREMAARGNTPDRVESLRRQLKRYLSEIDPVRPTPATRRSIEDALNLEQDALNDDDDEESDPVAALMAAVLRVVDYRVDSRMAALDRVEA